MIQQVINYLFSYHTLFLQEWQQYLLWVPVWFGAGCLLYFIWPYEPSLPYSLAAVTSSLFLIQFFKHELPIKWPCILMCLLCSGFLHAHIYSVYRKAPMIEHPLFSVTLTARLEKIESLEQGKRIVLSHINTPALAAQQTPKKIRLVVKTPLAPAQPGDIVALTANLLPPPGAMVPGGYNFSQLAYFQQIGAIGYTLTPVTMLEKTEKKTFFHHVTTLRHNITTNILAHMSKETGPIASALLTGERSMIDSSILTAIRHAGLAHLLAISGMHLVLVTGICFSFFRYILACSTTICLRINTKKIAALCALAGGMFYLLISGAPISAQRAYIMASIVLISIVLERNVTPMRSVALAAGFIIVYSPEALLTPSFQMSFAAAIALITSFDILKTSFSPKPPHTVLKKIPYHIGNITISSFVASIATLPFAIYHFNTIATYGIIANLIAIPLTSFFIMPLGIMALILMPYQLEALALIPMEYCLKILIQLAQYIANIPGSHDYMVSFSALQLSLLIFGGLWLCLWQSAWRRLGIIFIALAIWLYSIMPLPDIILHSDGKLFALQNKYHLILSHTLRQSYLKETWLKKQGKSTALNLPQRNNSTLRCDPYGCIYHKNSHLVAITQHPIALQEDCPLVTLLINLTFHKKSCSTPSQYINLWDLRNKGTHYVYLNNQIMIKTTKKTQGKRLWDNPSPSHLHH